MGDVGDKGGGCASREGLWFQAACWEEHGEEPTWAGDGEEGMRFQDFLRGLF